MKIRLDQYLVQHGMIQSRERAKALIMSGIVFVNEQKVDKAGEMIAPDAKVEVRGHDIGYVSRGGLKLEKAMQVFPMRPDGKVCMDIGASTGGFTDCMTVTKADKPDPTYRAEGQVENWFDKPEELMKEGYYSIMDSMETLQKSPAANKLLSSLMVKASNAYGDVAKNVKMPPEMESQIARTSLRSILKQVAKSITPADVQQLNAALNKIKKES